MQQILHNFYTRHLNMEAYLCVSDKLGTIFITISQEAESCTILFCSFGSMERSRSLSKKMSCSVALRKWKTKSIKQLTLVALFVMENLANQPSFPLGIS